MTNLSVATPMEAVDGVAKPRVYVSRGTIVAGWLTAIQDAERTSRGVLARLRRCPTPEAAACEPEAYTLAGRLNNRTGRRLGEQALIRAGFIAGIMAHLRTDVTGVTFGEMLAKPRGDSPGGSPRFSPGRFVRLCNTGLLHEAYPAFVRVLALLDHSVPYASLADCLVHWGDDGIDPRDPTGRRSYGDHVRIRLAEDYYGAMQTSA